MSVPFLHLVPTQSVSDLPDQNEFGETPLAFAPTIRLANGEQAVPQQYLDVNRNLDNLSNVLAHISAPKGYQLFAGQEGSCLFLIVGVVGKENYPATAEIAQKDKIVYGRRWLVEPTTPTSEIIQTSLLAIQKVREHEVRELFTLAIDKGKRVTTPFNCHLDLPLLAGNKDTLKASSDIEVAELIKSVKYAGTEFEIEEQLTIAAQQVFQLGIVGKSSHFPELANQSITVVCQRQDQSDFLHQLITALIAQSDRYVEESFAFKKFKRFSHNIDPIELAKFSYQTRNIESTDSRFDKKFEDMSYRVDASKAPFYNHGELGRQQRKLVSAYSDLGGYLPLEQ